jgi:DNA-binding IclR family transcriptional regulator
VTDELPAQARVRGKRPEQGEPVVDRALALLDAFDATRPLLTLSELSRRTGIPASSALRLAGRLLEWGALERDPAGRFSIGLRLWEVGSLAPRGHGLRQVALPFMGDLEEVTRQHVLLAVREGEEALMVERLSSHGAVAALYRPAAGCRCTPPGSGWSCSPSPTPASRRRCSPSR